MGIRDRPGILLTHQGSGVLKIEELWRRLAGWVDGKAEVSGVVTHPGSIPDLLENTVGKRD